MDPGPQDDTILSLQSSHRSEAIWKGEEYGVLTCRSHLRILSTFPVPEPVTNFISNTQFSGIQRLCYVPIDNDLITALVERWREETHTFHLPFGEVTITLQDVAVLFGLRVNGRPVTGSSDHVWVKLCEELLGLRPSTAGLKGSKLKLTWLHDNFQNLPNNANEATLHCHVRAYLLYLIGAVLFPDKSENSVSLLFLPLLEDLTQIDEISWGSGVLACLYRNMCKASKKSVWQIAGPILLLQLWSWERISIGRPIIRKSRVVEEEGVNYPLGSQLRVGVDPLGCKWLRVHRYYKDHRLGLNVLRDLLDKMVELQFVWVPYTTTILQNLSPRCSENQEEWLVITPLICFEVVEWHLPNRCVRQFGWHQTIPLSCNTSVELHAISRKGDNNTNYVVMHAESIGLWNNRMNKRVQPGTRYSGLMDHDDEYLKWYHAITRRLISPLSSMVYDDYENHHNYYPTAADYQTLTEGMIFNYNTTTKMLNNMPDDVPLGYYAMIEKIHSISLNALRKTKQGHLIGDEEPRESTPPRYDFRQLEHSQQHNPSQESEGRESSSRPQKKGKSRGEVER